MACIRQITAAVFLRPVIKSFAVLAAVLVTMVVAYLFYAKRMQFFALTPVFFGVYASLIFVEIGFWLHRETEEIIDFVERD